MGQCELVEKVIQRDLCVNCGACVGMCPYFDYFDGKVVVLDQCHSERGRCIQICPRLAPDTSSLNDSEDIGSFETLLIARSTDPSVKERAQYGGAVSAILVYALEKGIIDSALITDRGNGGSPSGTIATSKSHVLDCSGSRYTASGGLAKLNRALKERAGSIAVVGLPCQMEALTRMEQAIPDGNEWRARISMKIGLFCTWVLDYRKTRAFLEKAGISGPVKKCDIPPPPANSFRIKTKDIWEDIPLDQLRPFILKGCTHCEDMTAEKADISVGMVEGMDGWNTVIVRTKSGAALIKNAAREGAIEVGPLAEDNLEHLKEAARNKRTRGRLAAETFYQGK